MSRQFSEDMLTLEHIRATAIAARMRVLKREHAALKKYARLNAPEMSDPDFQWRAWDELRKVVKL